MQDLLAGLAAPLPADEVNERRRALAEILSSSADLEQAARCGRATLSHISQKLARWNIPPDQSQPPWAEFMRNCSKAFIEHCAEIVEACNAPQASFVLGAAVRLAEAVSHAGAFLVAMDNECGAVIDKLNNLETLYDALLKRVEALTAEQASAAKDAEVAAKLKESEQRRAELHLECRETKKALRTSEKKATELRRSLVTVQSARRASRTVAARSVSPISYRTSCTATPIDDPPSPSIPSISGDAHEELEFEQMRRSNGNRLTLHDQSLPRATLIADPASEKLGGNRWASARSAVFLAAQCRQHGPAGSVTHNANSVFPSNHDRHAPRATLTPEPCGRQLTDSMRAASRPSVLPAASLKQQQDTAASVNGDSACALNYGRHMPRATVTPEPCSRKPADNTWANVGALAGTLGQQDTAGSASSSSAPVSSRSNGTVASLLDIGSAFTEALSDSDPMAASAKAAFHHLSALLHQALRRYPSMSRPSIPQHLQALSSDPAQGLQLVADGIADWARLVLNEEDSAMASSLGQSALYLGCLVKLLPAYG